MTEYEITHGLSQDAPGPLEPVSAPTSHPIPTGATEDRDWELSCDECNGSGHVFVERQVAERKTDVQEFKEECEACEGRGFNIAFEDIPGIAEYVKSCRPASTAATEGAVKRLRDAIEGECGGNWMSEKQAAAVLAHLGINAPAAGDALAWKGLTKDEQDSFVGELIGYGVDSVAPLYSVVESIEQRLREKNAALAAQVPQQGEA